MFICNIKVNGKLLFKLMMTIMGIIVLGIFTFTLYKLFLAQQEENRLVVDDKMHHSNITEILPNNYTNILKAVHDNIDSYINKEIKFSGYIYRIIDFEENQFVLARDMLINSEAYVVGFLSEYDNIKDIEGGTWVEIIGTITKGKYHNQDIPIIKVNNLNIIEKPKDEYVLPPSDTYIPTSATL